MKAYLGTDHAGFDLKEKVKTFLQKEGYAVIDCGALTFDKNDDYPDFCSKAAEGVAGNKGAMGFVFGKSGAGECIVANKVKGIRAVLAINEQNVQLSREHNDANVLSLGSDFVSVEKACALAKLFLETPFSNEERHKRRIEKIKKLEESI